jgi:dTDP-4-amino-4,6-dideoxygalactose transaminase
VAAAARKRGPGVSADTLERTMIPVAKPVVGDAELEAVRRPLSTGWLTQGPEVAAFEREFAAFVGAPHACAVSNCTTALHLALRAAGVGPGDEVITVSHSFIATANAIRYCGAVPVFVDVQPDTYNIDPSRIVAALSPRTRALLVVHQLGMPCDLAAIVERARRHGVPVIEDAACAAGSEILWQGRWERIGRPHGDIACFSFHPRKVMTTGDGGMLTTANPELDRRFRLWRQHSMSVSDTARHASQKVVVEEYSELGFNYRMTDLQAAIGRVQLERLPAMVERRRALARNYFSRLAEISGLRLPVEPEWARSNWQSFCVRVKGDRDRILQALAERGISARGGIMNAHEQPAYQPNDMTLPRSEAATRECLILPLYPGMTHAQQDRVIQALAELL